jgi:3-oxoacyl-[acyl-carrier-protein] synthase II
MRRNPREDVWITGLGLGTPLGWDFATVADRLMAGTSGIQAIQAFDTSEQSCKIGGVLTATPVPTGFDADRFRTFPEWEQLQIWCAVQARRDAGIWESRSELRIGIVIGIGAEWVWYWGRDMGAGRRGLEPEKDSEGEVRFLQKELELRGPISTVAAACASGNIALGVGRQWIRQGLADIVLAGAAEQTMTPLSLASFGNLRALTRRNDNPAAASRPFDLDRDGFVMADGGAIFVLESEEAARRRGAKTYGAVSGFAATSDAFHLVTPGDDPQYAAEAVRLALRDAHANAEDVDHINAHATSTPQGDIFESRALCQAIGNHISNVPVSGTKSMTGHMLGAASAVEAAFCLMAFDRQTVPPTINLERPDPECPLRHVPNQAQAHPVNLAISTSFGFGGSNTCVVLRKVG